MLGWLEHVIVVAWNIDLIAKLDSGAKTSSIHAENIERYRRDGKDWVRFDLSDKKSRSAPETRKVKVELPVVRTTRIKDHGSDSDARPVVKLPICLGGKAHDVEFTLENRHNFNYPVLLGRSFLAGLTLIDPGRSHLGQQLLAQCKLRSESQRTPAPRPVAAIE